MAQKRTKLSAAGPRRRLPTPLLPDHISTELVSGSGIHFPSLHLFSSNYLAPEKKKEQEEEVDPVCAIRRDRFLCLIPPLPPPPLVTSHQLHPTSLSLPPSAEDGGEGSGTRHPVLGRMSRLTCPCGAAAAAAAAASLTASTSPSRHKLEEFKKETLVQVISSCPGKIYQRLKLDSEVCIFQFPLLGKQVLVSLNAAALGDERQPQPRRDSAGTRVGLY